MSTAFDEGGWIALGIRRLLKSMHEHKDYSPADSFSLCKGYAPHAPLYLENAQSLASEPGLAEDQQVMAGHGTDAALSSAPLDDDRQQNG